MSVETELAKIQADYESINNSKADLKAAIQEKGVTVDNNVLLSGYAAKVRQIPQLDTSDADATAADILNGKSAYVKGSKVEGSIPSKSAQTYNPSTSAQTIDAGQYLSGKQTIAATTASNVPSSLKETKSATPTKSTQTINATSGKLMTSVTVNPIPDQYIIPSGSQTIDANGTYDITSLAQVIVNVAGSGGGLPSGISKLDFGTITVSSAISTSGQTFTHNLGVIPDLMIVWAGSNVATTYSMLCAIRGGSFGWRSSAYNSHYAYHGNSTTTVTWANSNNANYGIGSMTATNFQLASISTSYYWRARSYNYIAIKF